MRNKPFVTLAAAAAVLSAVSAAPVQAGALWEVREHAARAAGPSNGSCRCKTICNVTGGGAQQVKACFARCETEYSGCKRGEMRSTVMRGFPPPAER